MTTTTTATAASSSAYAVVQEQLCWSWGDWLDHYGGDLADVVGNSYASSVITAADPITCRLSSMGLARLLAQHGFTVAELQADAHPLLPLEHAGQALTWLGY